MLMNAAAIVCFVIVIGVMVAMTVISGKPGREDGEDRKNHGNKK